MNGKGSMQGFMAMCGLAGAVLVLNACDQQVQGQGELAVAGTSQALTQDQVIPTGQVCAPTGKHAEHSRFECATCHQCAGALSFNSAVAGATAAFDATTKNCSNVACHAVPAGTFTYSVWDWGLEQTVPVTVPYGGAASGGQANWYAAAGAGCDTCHGLSPKYNGVAYTWHSGTHAYTTTINGNACQLCHPTASAAYVYGGPPSYVPSSAGLISYCAPGTYCSSPGTITNGALHGNGVVDVTPQWRQACTGCH